MSKLSIVALLTALALSPSALAQDQSAQASAQSDQAGGPSVAFELDSSFALPFSGEQAAQFRDIIQAEGASPQQDDPGFSAGLGSEIPATVTLSPLPARIMSEHPQLEGFLFFLQPDGSIAVVNPTTLRVVLVVHNG